jgi:hypothetical protein
LNGENTKNNLRNAVVTFKDTMRNLGGSMNERDTRSIGAINAGRGHPGRHEGLGRLIYPRRIGWQSNSKCYPGIPPKEQGYISRGYAVDSRGRGRGRYYAVRSNGKPRPDPKYDINLFIPKSILSSIELRYQAMSFRGRDAMEYESRDNDRDNTDDRKASAVTSDATLVSEILSMNRAAEDEDTSASAKFGAAGRKKRRTLGAVTSLLCQMGKVVKY